MDRRHTCLLVAVLATTATAARADFQNQVDLGYYEYDLKASVTASINTVAVTHYLSSVSTGSGLILEAPFMQRSSHVTATAWRYNWDYGFASGRTSMETLQAGFARPTLPVSLDIGLARITEKGYYDGHDLMLGIGYFVQQNTRISLQYFHSESEHRHGITTKSTSTDSSLLIETLLFRPAGHSLRLQAHLEQHRDKDASEFSYDSKGILARYYPRHRLGLEYSYNVKEYQEGLFADEVITNIAAYWQLTDRVRISVGRKKLSAEEGGDGYGARLWQLGVSHTF